MRALIIGPDERAAITKVVVYASLPENYYRAGVTRVIPGQNPAFVVHVPDGFRCVFTFTVHQSALFRHLSISVPGLSRYPSPEACVALAYEFGFTTRERDLNLIRHMEEDGWMSSEGHPGEHCIVLLQPVEGKGD